MNVKVQNHNLLLVLVLDQGGPKWKQENIVQYQTADGKDDVSPHVVAFGKQYPLPVRPQASPLSHFPSATHTTSKHVQTRRPAD